MADLVAARRTVAHLEALFLEAARTVATNPTRAVWLLEYPAHYDLDDLAVMLADD